MSTLKCERCLRREKIEALDEEFEESLGSLLWVPPRAPEEGAGLPPSRAAPLPAFELFFAEAGAGGAGGGAAVEVEVETEGTGVSLKGIAGTDAAAAAAAGAILEGELPRVGLARPLPQLPPLPPKVAPASATAALVEADGGRNSPAAPKASLPANGSTANAFAPPPPSATRGGEYPLCGEESLARGCFGGGG